MDSDLAVFKACADATRLRILFLLAVRELCVCEMMFALDLSQPKMSRHLALLREAGLVTDRRAGQWVYQQWGLQGCLWWSGIFVLAAGFPSLPLPRQEPLAPDTGKP